MNDKERSDVEPTGEEAPYRSPEEVAGKAGSTSTRPWAAAET